MRTGVSSTRKAARSEINHTPLSSAVVKDECSNTSNPPVHLHSMDKNLHFKSVFQLINQLKKRLVWWVCEKNKGKNEACQKYLEFPTRAKQKKYQHQKKQIGWMSRYKKREPNNRLREMTKTL